MHDFKLLAKPSPQDDRDFTVAKIVPPKLASATFPADFCYQGYTVRNQGQVGSCVAHSLSSEREIKEFYQSGKSKMFSPGFIYANRQAGQYTGEGMYPREALSNLLKYGCVTQDEFPYNDEYPIVRSLLDQDKDVLFEKATPYKITAYANVSTVNEIKTALMQLGPVSFMIPIYDSFYNTGSDGIIPIPNEYKETLNGYHQMLIIGWRSDNKWIILNSWDTDFGDNGLGYLAFNHKITEAWGITDSILPAQGDMLQKIAFTIDVRNIILDGVEKQTDVAAFIENDRTMVPLRFLSEAMGCVVRWNATTRTAQVFKGNDVYDYTVDSCIVKINNVSYYMDTPAVIRYDRIFVPVRFIAEKMGYTVGWDDATRSVTIER